MPSRRGVCGESVTGARLLVGALLSASGLHIAFGHPDFVAVLKEVLRAGWPIRTTRWWPCLAVAVGWLLCMSLALAHDKRRAAAWQLRWRDAAVAAQRLC